MGLMRCGIYAGKGVRGRIIVRVSKKVKNPAKLFGIECVCVGVRRWVNVRCKLTMSAF